MTSDSLICPRCGEEISAEAKACVACRVPLLGDCGSPREGNQLCAGCGEENPREAVMCWACYTPLPSVGCAQNSAWAQREAMLMQREAAHVEQMERAKSIARIGLLAGAVVSWLVSGYAPRRRGALLWTGALCLGGLLGWLKWEENAAIPAPVSPDEEPTALILNTILLYAVRDGASQVRLRAGIGVSVHYLIGGEWHEQMKIPSYVWDSLRQRLSEKTGEWESPMPFAVADKRFEFWGEFKRDHELPLEIVLLTLHRTN